MVSQVGGPPAQERGERGALVIGGADHVRGDARLCEQLVDRRHGADHLLVEPLRRFRTGGEGQQVAQAPQLLEPEPVAEDPVIAGSPGIAQGGQGGRRRRGKYRCELPHPPGSGLGEAAEVRGAPRFHGALQLVQADGVADHERDVPAGGQRFGRHQALPAAGSRRLDTECGHHRRGQVDYAAAAVVRLDPLPHRTAPSATGSRSIQ